MQVTALIVAAGSGSRMGGNIPKQYRRIGGKAVLAHAVDALAAHPRIGAVRVVVGDGHQDIASEALAGRDVGQLVLGGAERADSVRAGLAAISGDAVLVHDAARPFCPPQVVDRLLAALEEDAAAVPVLPIADTLARGGEALGDLVDRSSLVRVQTPQAFRLSTLIDTYAQWSGPSPTDESTVVRAAGLQVALVEGDPLLDKLTTAADFARAEQLFDARLTPRTGMGFDVHAFEGDFTKAIGRLEKAYLLDKSQAPIKSIVAGLRAELRGQRAEAINNYEYFVKNRTQDRNNWLAEIKFAENRIRILRGLK
jgi:2-C-methyl-D-erythritol 4-phosphate cytidylyltransferase/2-C-methyl-D-erythritol 2,4-cyclodiphosphate synthase